MSASENILRDIRDQGDDELIELSVDLKLTVADFRRAVLYGRSKKWSHERDREWAALIVAAIGDRVIQPNADEMFFLTAPRPLRGDVLA